MKEDEIFELSELLADEAFGKRGLIEYSQRQELTVKFNEILVKALTNPIKMKGRQNIPQLTDTIEQSIAYWEEMLQGEIRTIGLRNKITKRKTTYKKILKLLSNHKE